jgi:hypothetical protein
MSAPGQQAESTPDAPESAPAEAPATTETPSAPGSDGLDRLYARMEEMTAQQRQVVDSLTQLQQPPEDEALKDEYPDLQDAKVAQPILERAIRWAMGVDERIIERPEFVDVIEQFYKADQFESMRAQQQAEQPRPVVLEGAGGAGRTTRGPQEPDWQQRVIDAAKADGTRI